MESQRLLMSHHFLKEINMSGKLQLHKYFMHVRKSVTGSLLKLRAGLGNGKTSALLRKEFGIHH